MAIAGGGTPAKRMYIYKRQLRQDGLSHNVPDLVIKSAEDAAPLIALGESIYIEAVGDHCERLQRVLEEWGCVDPTFTVEEWIAWATSRTGVMA